MIYNKKIIMTLFFNKKMVHDMTGQFLSMLCYLITCEDLGKYYASIVLAELDCGC